MLLLTFITLIIIIFEHHLLHPIERLPPKMIASDGLLYAIIWQTTGAFEEIKCSSHILFNPSVPHGLSFFFLKISQTQVLMHFCFCDCGF